MITVHIALKKINKNIGGRLALLTSIYLDQFNQFIPYSFWSVTTHFAGINRLYL